MSTEQERAFSPPIKEIILENFMSYEYARIPLNQGLNLIVGPNVCPPRDLRGIRAGVHGAVEEAQRPHQEGQGDRQGLADIRQQGQGGEEAHPLLQGGHLHALPIPPQGRVLLVRGRLQGDRQERGREAPPRIRNKPRQPPDHNAPGDDRGAGRHLAGAAPRDGRGGRRFPRIQGEDTLG